MADPEDAKSIQNVTILAKNIYGAPEGEIPSPTQVIQWFSKKRVPTLGEKLKKDSLLARTGATILRKTIQNSNADAIF